MEHYTFFTRKKSFNESFYTFYADLWNLVKSCGIGEVENKLLGTNNVDLQSKLLREDYTIEKLVSYCQAIEQAKINKQILLQNNKRELNIVVQKENKFGGPVKHSVGKRQNKGEQPNIIEETLEEHNKTLKEVIDQARNLNIKFNPYKLQFERNKVKYLGMAFNRKRIASDADRVKAIMELKEPEKIKQLQSLLRMINYLWIFIPNISELVEPLRGQLKKEVLWE
ncbi:Hypothetical protein CINCED_3A013109 [Cinara cedri]|uniref:Reverse transcriptase domain n=1 Tax=Cinara cedri TaxID=506608 RepID=A0A5E4N1V2_9HEMI|nr:Hypothetical protein CINCED_3A013109 [Cinara cedri]